MPDSLKQGWFDKLFSSFSKDVKTTGLVLLTLLAFYQQSKINSLNQENKEDQNKWVERVIIEVQKQNNPRLKTMEDKIDTIKSVSDSSRTDIRNTTKQIRAVAGKIEKSFSGK